MLISMKRLTTPAVTCFRWQQNTRSRSTTLRCVSCWGLFREKIPSICHPDKHYRYELPFHQNWTYIHGRHCSQRAVKRKSRRTFYDMLDIHPSATQTEIKSAYYELSMKYHPDISSSVEARDHFTEITKAYSVLNKLESRREYDKEIGTYYMMRNYPKKSSEKVLRLMDDLLEIDMSNIKQPSTFLSNVISLSSILRVPVRLNNINNQRGIQSHDIRMLQLLRKVCNGTLVANKGSSTVTFIPSELQSGLFTCEAGRFGSISLLIESALPSLMFGPLPEYSRTNILSLKGTTHCNYGLHMDYIDKIYRPLLKQFGLDFTLEMRKKSYVPHWDGKVVIRSLPRTHITPASLTNPGSLTKITSLCFVAGSKPVRVAQIMSKNVLSLLKKRFPRTPTVVDSTRDRDSRCEGNGQGVIIIGETSAGHMLGGTALWQKGMSSDEVVNKAVNMFIGNVHSGACVDDLLQDKVILLMALARGHSTICSGPLTARTQAAIMAVETLTKVKFSINRKTNPSSVVISCEGLGLTNEYLDDDVTQ